MRPSRLLSALASILAAAAAVHADVKMPAIFGDHMVLQRDTSVPVWGWADAGETVTVTVTAGAAKATTTTAADGKWMVKLDQLKASAQPIELTVAGKNTVKFTDVLVGDVWVCSGQSNMEFPLSRAHDVDTALPKANYPQIRLFMVTRKVAFEPQTDCTGKWVVCTPSTAKGFSAVGYFFARDLHEKLGVPMGMIGTYWGGTPIQAWTSLDALAVEPTGKYWAQEFENIKAKLPELADKYQKETLPKWQTAYDAWKKEVNEPYQAALKEWATAAQTAKAAGQPEPPKPQLAKSQPYRPDSPLQSPNTSTVLNNGMIAPIVPYAIKGAIWYQGESNSWAPAQYRKLFPDMITGWRKSWNQGDFPFLFVQLANFMARADQPTDTNWALLREAQSMTLSLPNTGQAVIIDIGQGNDIHPRNKTDVGARLALAARRVAYGEQNLVYSGPTYDAMKVEGDHVRLTFTNIGSGLTIAGAPATDVAIPPAAPARELKGFAVAGADQKFVWAQARIDGSAIIVQSDQVKEPVAVRYGWADNPEVNLYNKEGLPASPFRTDDWSAKPPAPAK